VFFVAGSQTVWQFFNLDVSLWIDFCAQFVLPTLFFLRLFYQLCCLGELHIMNITSIVAAATIVAALAPTHITAATVDFITVTTEADFIEGGLLIGPDVDTQTGLANGPVVEAESLVLTTGNFVPGIPNSVGTGFGSAVGDSVGNFGVGVNSVAFRNASPASTTTAKGSILLVGRNDTSVPVSLLASFFIPAPVIFLSGGGLSVNPNIDPFLDFNALVDASVNLSVNRAVGPDEEISVLQYGMIAQRSPVTRVMDVLVDPGTVGLTIDRSGSSVRADLPSLTITNQIIATLDPGDEYLLDLSYIAFGRTGIGETGYFAAIGDPFDIVSGGGSLSVAFGDVGAPVDPTDPIDPAPVDPTVPAPVPLPGTLMLFASGLLALPFLRRRRLDSRPAAALAGWA
jgi:PEP-CTERM motif